MELPTTTSYSVVSEFEGTLLKNPDSFSYFMLVAYEVSGLIRFTIMLFLYPVIALLDVFGCKNAALKLMIFLATAGVRESEIELVARAVLPKFYMDDVSMDTWNVLSSCKKKKFVVVATKMPRVMVEMFAKDHLGADEVIGTELIVNRFGYVTGLIRDAGIDQSVLNRVANIFVDRRPPQLGLGRPAKKISTNFLSLCEEQIHAPVNWNHHDQQQQQLEVEPPTPVVFYDGRFEKRPTPAMALLILFWFPFGIILATVRILFIFVFPFWALPYVLAMLGIRITVKGKPQQWAARNSSLLFVSNHRTMIDSVVISCALGHSIQTITLTASGLPNILSPIPQVRIKRIREVDAETMKQALSKGDVLIFPEAVLGRSPFLLRFSALFAELTDNILPVAINNVPGFFHNIARNMAPPNFLFLFMNPTLVYEVTFLDQLPVEATCASGKDMYDVANHVQRTLADTLGFKCTNFTKKDMLKVLT